VLHEIYIHAPAQYHRGNIEFQITCNDHILAKKLDITNRELDRNIWFLSEHELINDHNDWRMKQKGFELASQNEKIESDKKVQCIFLAFAAIMVILEIIPYIIPAINFIIR
jgi:hypothetical protein